MRTRAVLPLSPAALHGYRQQSNIRVKMQFPSRHHSILFVFLLSITTILLGTSAPAADAVWIYAGLKPDEISTALGIPADSTHTVRKVIGDDSLSILYIPGFKTWRIQFEYNSTNVISKSFSATNPRFQPYFFVRTKDGLGKGRFESDFLMRNDVFMFEHEGAQIVRMDISEKDLTAIKNGFDLGIRYYIEIGGTKVQPSNFMFSNRNFRSAIAELEAAIE